MQLQFSCLPKTLSSIQRGLSKERFRRYLVECHGDRQKALHLYFWNMQLAQALYNPLQMMEIVLRNTISDALVRRYGADWPFNRKFHINLKKKSHQELISCIERQRKQRKRGTITTGEVVADLPFGFWVSMLSPGMNIHVWQRELAISFPNMPERFALKNIEQQARDLNKLRNRIAHHEPVFNQSIPNVYREITRLTEWVNDDVAWWIVQTSNVMGIFEEDPR